MTEPQHDYTEVLSGDDRLIDAVREGDTGAYATLYERHHGAARGLARQMVRGDAEVDDVVAEAFTRVLSVVQRGGGPRDGFRPYLLTAVRHVVYDRSRGDKRQVVTDDMESFDRGEPFVDPALEGLERSLIARAFLSLPERWQSVLWHTEIEGSKPGEVAPHLGMSANSVAALAYRAREGLRQAYLQMHLASGAPAESCRPTLDQLGAYVRDGLAKRDTASVDRHLDGCGDCRAVYAELMDVNVGLRGIVLPLFAGPAAAGYLAALPAGAFSGGWWGRMPKRQQQATAAGAAAVAVAAAAALALVSDEQPLRPQPEQPAAAPGQPAPPGDGGGGGGSGGGPGGGSGGGGGGNPPGAPPAAPPGAPQADPPADPDDPAAPDPARPDDPRDPAPSPKPPRPPGTPAFAAEIDPVGSLVPGKPGIIVMNVRNTGERTAEDVVASIDLPEGVTLTSAPGRGNAAPAAPAPEAGGDGWTCSPADTGAECVLMGMDAGADSSEYLDVDVAGNASEGDPPRISVSSGTADAVGEGSHGVDPEGMAARYATAGPVRTESVGNALLSCVDEEEEEDEGGDGHPWPWWPDTPADTPTDPPTGPAVPTPPTTPPTAPPGGPDADDRPAPPALPGGDAPTEGPGLRAPEPPKPTAPTAPPRLPRLPIPDDPAPAPTAPADPTPSAPPSSSPEPPDDDGPCAQAQQRKGDKLDNDLWDMRPMDRDRDPSTTSSSSARWTLPEGGKVRWAGLYFSGVGAREGADAKLRGPGAAAYTTVRASEVESAELPGYSAYKAFADVTEQVAAHGGGEWWVADAPTETGVSAYAGWSLVVVLEDPAEAYNQAMVLDGTGSVFQDESGLRFPLAGLTPRAVPATVDVAAWEGDAGLEGDRVLLNDAPLTPQGARRTAGNAFASASRGAVGDTLTFGNDVARFSSRLPDRPELNLVSTGDAYLAGVVAVTSSMRT
ncbi:RNA polymerase sigma factor (sigma-70 family) [Murinocardiopsis flavida]|uniref:RNA polymerase sigma factor (Sigma-70 family) n=1 Tax=Murinocardiopsis flavida TaxID=645275 RepID=A0A2P8DGG6_9ACTN|nr:sigma-70 family RNA polymerase sigma factor [Murinocardiopsis flavida]PSK96315.1 RNA polymerase sigma factor (sigma-70 family) [Murinocardiopsis flavida]